MTRVFEAADVREVGTAVAWLLLALGMPGVIAGCATRRPVDPPVVESASARSLPYRIHVGDALDVRFYGTPELNTKATVRSDGKISLELVGDVAAAGQTPEGFARLLGARYAGELRDPTVTVVLQSFGGQIFVAGEVKRPTAINFAHGMTALQAIASAGGFRDTANLHGVVLMRVSKGEYRPHRLALNRAVSGKDLSPDLPLEPADVLYVPKTGIAEVNLIVDQYIKKVLPDLPYIPPIF
jgi:protein involved in polysaccharide export with SLBB domain